jgi:hypothetical protein
VQKFPLLFAHSTSSNASLAALARHLHQKVTWKRVDEDTILIAYEDCDDEAMLIVNANKGYARASSFTYVRLTKKEPLAEGVPQTEVEYVSKVGLGGLIPTWIMRLHTISFLETLSDMRKKFDLSEAIDEIRHKRLAKKIKSHDEGYSQEENELVDLGKANLTSLTTAAKAKKVKGATPEIKNTVAFKEGDKIGWGKSVTEVHGTKEMVSLGVSERSGWQASMKGQRRLLAWRSPNRRC